MSDITIFPQPRQLDLGEGQFTLNSATRILTHEPALGQLLAEYLRPATSYALPVQAAGIESESDVDNTIVLAAPGDSGTSSEAYTLTVRQSGIVISAAEKAGFIHALQTLRQLLPADILSRAPVADVEWTIPGSNHSRCPGFLAGAGFTSMSHGIYSVRMTLKPLSICWHFTNSTPSTGISPTIRAGASKSRNIPN